MSDRPPLAPETRAMPGAIYSPFADRMSEHRGPIYPLHVGDTWRDPFVGARSEDIHSADHPRLHAYGNTRGLPELVERIREKLANRNDLAHTTEEILVTAGATGGLAALAGAALSPGDEILILAPFWPLIRGIAQSFRAMPVEVPFFDRVDSLDAAIRAVESRITSRSRVLYVSTPSNPTGRVIPGQWLEALAALARRLGSRRGPFATEPPLAEPWKRLREAELLALRPDPRLHFLHEIGIVESWIGQRLCLRNPLLLCLPPVERRPQTGIMLSRIYEVSIQSRIKFWV